MLLSLLLLIRVLIFQDGNMSLVMINIFSVSILLLFLSQLNERNEFVLNDTLMIEADFLSLSMCTVNPIDL